MTQAAKKLNITQPALSSYLAGVENGLGYPLFERTGKALRPTYLGELYLEKARKILALGEEFQHQREQVLHGYQGRIRVGIPIRRSPHLIPSALKIFRGRFPNVEVIVQEGNQRAMTEMLREDQLDLMLCNLVNQEGELEYEHLCWDPVIFLVQSAHPCCRHARYRDTFYHPWIDLREFEQEILFCSTWTKPAPVLRPAAGGGGAVSPEDHPDPEHRDCGPDGCQRAWGLLLSGELFPAHDVHSAAPPLLCGRTPAGG